MAQEKSIKVTVDSTSRWYLDERPSSKARFIYQAIILSLAVHVFVLSVIYLLNAKPVLPPDENTAVVQEMELKFEEPEPVVAEDALPSNMSEAVRNLIANRNAERTHEQVSYRGKSKEAMEQEVWDALHSMEQAEFDRLKAEHPELEEAYQEHFNEKRVEKTAEQQQEEAGNKSYSGPVAVDYDVKGRVHVVKRVPTYRCKGSGRVVVRIEVEPDGDVVTALVDDALSAVNACLRSESEQYALLWKFDTKPDAAKREPGTITFTFNAQ